MAALSYFGTLWTLWRAHDFHCLFFFVCLSAEKQSRSIMVNIFWVLDSFETSLLWNGDKFFKRKKTKENISIDVCWNFHRSSVNYFLQKSYLIQAVLTKMKMGRHRRGKIRTARKELPISSPLKSKRKSKNTCSTTFWRFLESKWRTLILWVILATCNNISPLWLILKTKNL